MFSVGLMIEGQDGLTWPRWQRLVQAAELFGFSSLFRSDHFTNRNQPAKESLELWVSLTYATTITNRIRLGSLVSSITSRHPAITAMIASAVNELSNGRLTLGLGASWQEWEHRMFGIPFPPRATRLDMLEEALEVITHLLRSDIPTNYSGKYYSLNEAGLSPNSSRVDSPLLLVGGYG